MNYKVFYRTAPATPVTGVPAARCMPSQSKLALTGVVCHSRSKDRNMRMPLYYPSVGGREIFSCY